MSNCPACNTQSKTIAYRLTHDIYRCNNCRLLFAPNAKLNESFSSSLDEENRAKALYKVRKDNFNKIILSIKKHLPKPEGLEVGCGYGWFLEACKINNITCEGIEPETIFNETYKSKNLRVINGYYPESIPLNKKYNFISFNDSIEHIPNILGVIDSCRENLQENGLLIINLPIQNGLIFKLSKIAYWFGIKSAMNRMWQFDFHSPHLYYFNKKNITDLASKSGFKKVESFKLKTINVSEIASRIKQDKDIGQLSYIFFFMGTLCIYPFLNILPDTYCFIFKRNNWAA